MMYIEKRKRGCENLKSVPNILMPLSSDVTQEERRKKMINRPPYEMEGISEMEGEKRETP